MIIYTAIFNNYDRLPISMVRDSDIQYVCFTDCIKGKKRNVWEIVHTNPALDNFRKNRFYKINSHKIFDDDIVVYIDPTFLITKNFKNKIEEWLGDNDIGSMMHYKRNSIYEEAEFLIKVKPHKLDSVEVVRKQMDMYRREGFPEDIGINQGGFIIRRNTDKVKKFNEYWWDIVQKYSKRDQLSFTYVSWKLGIPFSVLPRDEVESHTTRIAWHK